MRFRCAGEPPVRSTGPGVPEHMHEAIFEKFRQGDARVSYEHGDTGLGLALSRGLKGRLVLQSVPDNGSCFSLFLPLRSEPPVTVRRALPEPETAAA